MQTSIHKVSDVEYTLEITASRDDLAHDVKAALRSQRTRTELKGFRPGKVPLQLVKKMHGRAIAYGVAEQKVQEAFEREVINNDAYDVLGQPRLTELDYEMDGDLRARIQFGVRPIVELADLAGEKVSKLIREVSEEDVDEQIERLRLDNAELVPVDDEEIGDDFQVIIDLQRLDERTGTPIIGEKDEDVEFFVDDQRLHEDLREGLLGRKVGDTFRVNLPHGEGDHAHTHHHQVLIKDAKRRDLPEMGDEFVKEVTRGRFDTVDALRNDLRKSLESAWQERSREMLDGQIVDRMLEIHPLPVPEGAIESFVDSFVEDVKRRNEGTLPEGFDLEAFRSANWGEAERQARWMLIRDAYVEKERLDVTDADLDAFFGDQAAENEQFSADVLRQYYQSMNMIDRVKQQILSRKVFDRLAEVFSIEEKVLEAFEEEMRGRRQEGERRPDSTLVAPGA